MKTQTDLTLDSRPEREREKERERKERELIVYSRKAINAADGASALAIFSQQQLQRRNLKRGRQKGVGRKGVEEGEKI